MDFPKKQAQRLMPLYLLEYSEKLFTNHPDPSAPWGGGGGSDYTAGQGITITNNEISVDTNVIATKSDLPTKTSELTNDSNFISSSLDNRKTYSKYESSPLTGSWKRVTYDTNGILIETNDSTHMLGFPIGKEGEIAVTSDIPTVNNPTITFTQGGATKGTITLNQSGDQTIEFDAGASLPNSPFLRVKDPQDQMFFSLNGSDSSWYKYVNLSDAHNRMFYVNLSALNPVFKDGLTSTYNEQTNQLEVGLNAVIPTKTSDLFNDSGYVTETWVENKGYATSSSLATVATTGDYNDLTNKPSIPSTATSTSTSTVTPTTGTFVTGTSTNTADVVNSVTYTPSSETLTFTYADNTTASFTFLTSSTTVTSGTTSVVTSVTDSTSNAMTGATVSTSTTTTLS